VTRWVLVAGDFAPHGGMDRANYALACFLASAGDAVELVTHRAAPELAALPGVSLRQVHRPLGSHFLGGWGLSRAGKAAARLARAAGGRVIVNGGNCVFPDVNWVHYVHAAYRPDSPRGWLRGLKGRLARPLDLRAERAALREARVVVCNSRRTARDVVELVGVAEARVRVVYLGTDPARFPVVTPAARSEARDRLGWPQDRPVVLFIGALGDARKGFDTLYAAWRELCRDPRWDANLAVVGAGAALAGWRSQAAADALAGRIGFLGFRTDVPEILAASDVLVHPARYEPYGMGVHEALCSGLPAIVSAASGVSERYPADLAELILADPEDAGELAARLRHWRANPESLALCVRPLADELRSRTWAEMARELRDTVLGVP
jgi:glycosyltransferase involved in cell wall biosynthesis